MVRPAKAGGFRGGQSLRNKNKKLFVSHIRREKNHAEEEPWASYGNDVANWQASGPTRAISAISASRTCVKWAYTVYSAFVSWFVSAFLRCA